MTRSRSLLIGASAIVAIGGGTGVALASHGHGGGERTYSVTVTNATLGQPFSPPFLAVHGRHADLWSVGDVANHAVAAIAEDANNDPAIMLAGKIRGVKHAFTGIDRGASAPAPIGPGGTQTYTVTTKGRYDRLSLLTMLVNTNDGLTGLDSVRLPDGMGTSMRYDKMAYDAGSEANNEKAAFIPGPVGGNRFVRDPEGDVIRMHPGVTGGNDLDPVTHRVSGTVATITITRVR